MCERTRSIRTTLVTLLLAASSPLAAQAPSDTTAVIERLEAELSRRTVEFERARGRAGAEKARLDSIREARAQVPHDTLRIGPLTVLVTAERAEDARAGLENVWRDVAPIFRGRETWLSGFVLIVDPDRRLNGIHPRGRSQRIFGRSWRTFVFDSDLLEMQAREALAREADEAARRPLREWTSLAGILEAADAPDLEEMYRRLVLHPAPAMQGCYEGDPESCWTAMGLGLDEEPVEQWVGPAQLEAERARYREDPLPAVATRPGRPLAPWLRCQSEWAAHCDEFFVGRSWMRVAPMPVELRTDLLAFALRRGGPGSLDRLLSGWPPPAEAAGDDPTYDRQVFATVVRERLAAASGMDERELMEAWRARLVSAGPDLRAGVEAGRLSTFLWILLFAAFAVRSTRWRLG